MTDHPKAPKNDPMPHSMTRLREGLAQEQGGYAYGLADLSAGVLAACARAPLPVLGDFARGLVGAPRTTASGWSFAAHRVEGGILVLMDRENEAWSLRLRFEPSCKRSLGLYLSEVDLLCRSAKLGSLPLTSGDVLALYVSDRDPGSRATSLPSSRVYAPGMGPDAFRPFEALGEVLREAGHGDRLASTVRELPLVSSPYSRLFAAGAAAAKEDGGVPGEAVRAVVAAYVTARARRAEPEAAPEPELQP